MNDKDQIKVNHEATKATVTLERKFACPCCNKHSFPYSHLTQLESVGEKGASSYTWVCPKCVANVSFSVDSDDFSVTITATVRPSEGHAKTLALLELNTGNVTLKDPIHIVVEKNNYVTKTYTDDLVVIAEQLKYYYEEQVCPSDYLGVVAVLDGYNDDPHGLFTFKEVIWKPEDFRVDDLHNSGGDWSELFPSLRNHSEHSRT